MINLNSIKYIIRNWTWKFPYVYYLFQAINGGLTRKDKALTVKETDIVIEGFPRCGNTFVHEAFEFSQKETVNIAHHFHAPPSIVRAVNANKPAILLLRNPIDCVVSLILRQPNILISDAIQSYIDFHTVLLPWRDDVVIADFDDIQTDLGLVIKKINQKFDSEFLIFEHTKENEKACFDRIDKRNALYLGSKKTDPLKVARPTVERSQLKSEMMSMITQEKYAKKISEAQSLYQLYIA